MSSGANRDPGAMYGGMGTLSTTPTESESAREAIKLGYRIWEEFDKLVEANMPNLNDLLVLAATNVAKRHFSAHGALEVLNHPDGITIKVKP